MPVAGLLEEVVEIPDGVQLRVDGDFVVVTGGGHTLRRRLSHPRLRIDVKGQAATVRCDFPRKATVKGSEFIIENFLGEKFPRKTRILGETKVEVKGDQVLLTGADVEAVGQTAANIELATRIRGFDPRIFQDGIYITKKAGEA